MKIHAVTGIFVFSVVALNLPAQTSPAPKPAQKPAAAATAPGTKTPPAAPAAKKEEKMGVIEGVEIKRGAGYMGISAASGTFKLTFYDAKKKPVAPDVARAALRWPVNYKPLDERTVLNLSEDGKSLTSAKPVKPPLVFILYITLIPAGGGTEENASETFVVPFKG